MRSRCGCRRGVPFGPTSCPPAFEHSLAAWAARIPDLAWAPDLLSVVVLVWADTVFGLAFSWAGLSVLVNEVSRADRDVGQQSRDSSPEALAIERVELFRVSGLNLDAQGFV